MRHVVTAFLLLATACTAPSVACTGVLACDGKVTLAGNNEDYFNPYTKVHFLPPEEGKYGRIYFGFNDNFPQGGVNDQGLFFDGFATAPLEVTKSKDKPKCGRFIMQKVMEECATVEEALKVFDRYNLEFMEKAMFMIGDKTGDSAIIEGDDVVRKKGAYQVCTNFYQSKVKGDEYPCERYNIATELLENEHEVSVDLIRRILAATHQEWPASTVYSNIYDLRRGKIHLYHFHNFENVVTLDIDEELAKRERIVDLPTLFPNTYAASAFERMRQAQAQEERARRAATDVDPRVYDDYVGRYQVPEELAPDMTVTVTKRDDKLYIQGTGQDEYELTPESESHFFVTSPAGDAEATFMRDETGRVTQIVVKRHGVDIACKRIE